MNDSTPRPFFIVGHPRSGTTLLRFMLSSHPRLFVPDETGFLPFLETVVGNQVSFWPQSAIRPKERTKKKRKNRGIFSDPQAELDQTAVSSLLRRIGQLNRFWEGLVSDEAAFYAALPRPTLSHVLDALYRLQIPPGTARWGDKTPLYVQYMPQIQAIFPRAQFIHIIRDGRDAALSARAKWGRSKPYMDLSYLLSNWVRNVQAGQAAAQQLGPQRYYEIRYESLVSDPAATLKGLCAYLDEPYDAAMLAYREMARREGGGIDAHVEAQEVLYARSIGRWQREMSLFERKVARAIAGPLLVELGYDPDQGLAPLTSADRLRLAWLSARFKALDTLRSWLYQRGLRTLNYNRR